MSLCFIGLGSNLGDDREGPCRQLQRARDAIAVLPQTSIVAASSLYRSAAMILPGSAPQPDYCNAVLAVQTGLSPFELLDALHAIERAQGRERTQRWASRTLDLDILMYDDLQLNDSRLTIPHPGMASRSFVLYPWHEIAPDCRIPGMGALAELLARLPLTTGTLEITGRFDD